MTDTPQKLIESASRVFAEKGYHDATILEICEGAGANVALVNYHFGDKENLYERVWRHAFEKARERFPIDGGLPEGAPPIDRVRAFVKAMLGRVFCTGEAGHFARIMVREMANPTAALPRIVDEALRPQMAWLMKAVREVLGPGADERQVRLCALSVTSQSTVLSFSRPVRRNLLGPHDFAEKDIDLLADHIVRFSIGGLHAIGHRGATGLEP